jgi:hypothetical protein
VKSRPWRESLNNRFFIEARDSFDPPMLGYFEKWREIIEQINFAHGSFEESLNREPSGTLRNVEGVVIRKMPGYAFRCFPAAGRSADL